MPINFAETFNFERIESIRDHFFGSLSDDICSVQQSSFQFWSFISQSKQLLILLGTSNFKFVVVYFLNHEWNFDKWDFLTKPVNRSVEWEYFHSLIIISKMIILCCGRASTMSQHRKIMTSYCFNTIIFDIKQKTWNPSKPRNTCFQEIPKSSRVPVSLVMLLVSCASWAHSWYDPS